MKCVLISALCFSATFLQMLCRACKKHKQNALDMPMEEAMEGHAQSAVLKQMRAMGTVPPEAE
jgi:hypothetical protein